MTDKLNLDDKPAWFKESFLDIREDIDEARQSDKRVVLYFYQDGCPYCAKLLQDNFGNADIATKTRKHFDVIAINMWGDREVVSVDGQPYTEKELAEVLAVQYTPTMVFFDERGDFLSVSPLGTDSRMHVLSWATASS